MEQPTNNDGSMGRLVDFYRAEAAKGDLTMEELIASVGRTYWEDIERFGYSFPSYE